MPRPATLAMFRARQRSSCGVQVLFGLETPPHGGAALRAASVVRLWQGLRTKLHFTCFEDEDAARGATGLPERGKRWWSGHYEITLRNAAVAAVNVTTARPAVTPKALPIAFQSQPVLTNARTASTM